jgi:hypothetical protein
LNLAPQNAPVTPPHEQLEQLAAGAVNPVPPAITAVVDGGQAGAVPVP